MDPLAIAGIVVGVIGLGWAVYAVLRLQPKRAEKQAARDLVDWLAGKRVLWNPMIDEIPVEATASVLEIRERVDSAYGSFHRSEARSALAEIRSACLSLLDSPREWWGESRSPDTETELTKFREQMRPVIERLARTYGIEVPQWQSFRGGWEPGTEGEKRYVPPPDDLHWSTPHQ